MVHDTLRKFPVAKDNMMTSRFSEILIKPIRYVILHWLTAHMLTFQRRVLTPSIKAAKRNKPRKVIMFKVFETLYLEIDLKLQAKLILTQFIINNSH